jgi:hypothetical protein
VWIARANAMQCAYSTRLNDGMMAVCAAIDVSLCVAYGLAIGIEGEAHHASTFLRLLA